MTTTKRFWYYILALIGAAFMLFSSCEKENVPVLSTAEVTEITQTTATSGGNITNDGGAAVTTRGVVWSTSENPTVEDNEGITADGEDTGKFASELTGLTPNTNYYVRGYAINMAGIGYGQQESFETLKEVTGAVDADGNVYATVVIGDQEWMAENLRTTKYNDDTPILTGHSSYDWAALTTGAYAVYPHSDIDGLNSEAEVLEDYGALYNWDAVNTGNLCPTGWRVPTDAEWTALTNYVGGENVAGGKLKSTRNAPDAHPRWDSPNTGATDEYGFSALPGGYRNGNYGDFGYVGYNGYWWSSTEYAASSAWSRRMYCDLGLVNRFADVKRFGFSVRCVRDN